MYGDTYISNQYFSTQLFSAPCSVWRPRRRLSPLQQALGRAIPVPAGAGRVGDINQGAFPTFLVLPKLAYILRLLGCEDAF